MKKLLFILFPFFLIAQEPNKDMIETYEIYKKIQSIIHDDKSEVTNNKDELKELITKLNISLINFGNYYKKDQLPGFKDNLDQLTGALSQVERQLEKENSSTSWAIWRLKAITTNCQTCHSNFSTEIHFKDSDIPEKLDDFNKAEFFLATRQFEDAEKSYWKYISLGSYGENGFYYVFNRWIDLQIRILQTPDIAIQKIELFLNTKPKISEYEIDEVKNWLSSIKNWVGKGGKISTEFNYNKKLIQSLLTSKSPIYENIELLNLLRASAGFNKAYESKSISEEHKRQIMYYLGLIYSKIPTFFIYELPELYLKSCIKRYPKTKEAQMSFNLLKNIVIEGATGSGGTHIDTIVNQELDELYKLAYK